MREIRQVFSRALANSRSRPLSKQSPQLADSLGEQWSRQATMASVGNPTNLVSLIRSVQPKAALFTTFTISLSFVDAVLLPLLRQVGCRDIFILVDSAQAELSLEEASSPYAGRHYWLAQVVPPGGGCFHPKLAYLRGSNEDVLAVGSGNLTQPGQSGQLECLDVVDSLKYPAVFSQFADFATTLATHIELASPRAAEFLGEFAQRARSVGKNSGESPNGDPRLIHTVEHPASTQLVDIWSAKGTPARRLTVLTPFHAPDGAPIQRLATALGAQSLNVGLDCRSLVAPFDRKRLEKGVSAGFVVPVFPFADRPLHAKVFEVSAPGKTLVMTGSVNGTAQSLESTSNVEVSLTRWMPESCFSWEKVTPKDYAPNIFHIGEGGRQQVFLEATLGIDGVVRGRVTSKHGQFPRAAMAAIYRDERALMTIDDVQLREGGDFSFLCPAALDTAAAVQLELTGGPHSVMCWLNIAEDLQSSDQERRERQAVRHILEGRFDEQDVFELLSMLSRAAQEGATPRVGPARSGTGTDDALDDRSDSDSTFRYSEWITTSSASVASLGTLRNSQAVDALIAWLNRSQRSAAEEDGLPDGRTSEVRGFRYAEEEQAREPVNKRDLAAQFETLLALIPKVLSAPAPPPGATLLAKVAGASATVLMLRTADTGTWPTARVSAWLDEYSRFRYPPEDLPALSEFALAVALVASAVESNSGKAPSLSLFKEALFRFKDTWHDDEFSPGALARILSDKAFRLAPPDLLKAAALLGLNLLNAQTLDEQLIAIATRARTQDEDTRASEEEMFPGVFRALKKQFRGRAKPGQSAGVLTKPREVDAGGCYHCGMTLGDAGRKRLREKHVSICGGCGKPTFYTANSEKSEELQKVLRSG